jgi:arylsulfatase
MIVSRWAETFKDFPPIQKPNTFTIGDAIEKMSESSSGDDHQEGYISLLFD